MRVIEKTSWSASSDVSVLPVIPCFVLDTTTTEFWYVTATESTKVSGGGGGAVAGVKGDAESTYRTGTVNLTPANIGALALTGGTLTGDLNIQRNNIDRDGANPSGNQWYVISRTTDKDGETISMIQGVRRTSGRIDSMLMAYNETTDGTQVENRIQLGVDRSGTQVYYVSDAAAFRNAIAAANATHTHNQYYDSTNSRTANTVLAAPNGSAGSATFRKLVPADCSWLGDEVSKEISSAVSIANNAWKTLGSITLTTGKWIVTAGVRFDSASAGVRYAVLCDGQNASPSDVYRRMTMVDANAVSGDATYLHTSTLINITGSSFVLYWNVYQNSGSARNCTGRVRAFRIA